VSSPEIPAAQRQVQESTKVDSASKDGKQLAEECRYKLKTLLRDGLEGSESVFNEVSEYLFSMYI
jgi:hypothetical protein